MLTLIKSSTQVARLTVADALAPDTLEALAEGEMLAIVVPDFTPRDCCAMISERLINDHRLGGYSTSDGAASIKKIGMPLFEVAGRNPHQREAY
jgi:hypothetical protein